MNSGAWQTDRLSHSEAHFALQLRLARTDREGERLWQTEKWLFFKLAACVLRLWIPLRRWERGGGWMLGQRVMQTKAVSMMKNRKEFLNDGDAGARCPKNLSRSVSFINQLVWRSYKWLCKRWTKTSWDRRRECVCHIVCWQRQTEVRWS